MPMSRRLFLAALAVAGGVIAAAPATAAFAPTKPVTLIVPYGAGGGTDLVFRTLVQIINDKKIGGTNWVILNREGGAGMSGMQFMLTQKGDTHTLMAMTPGHLVIPKLQKLDVSWKQLTPVANLVIDPQILVVSEKSGFKTLDDMVAAVKAGKNVRVAGGAIGQDDHLTNLIFQEKIGHRVNFVAFKGGGEMRQSLLGGHVEAGWLNPNELSGMTIKDGGTLIPVGVALGERLVPLPDIPTMKEQGVDVIYDMFFRSLVAPPGVGQDVVDFYVGVLDKVIATPEWAEFVKKIGSVDSYVVKGDFAAALQRWDAQIEKIVPQIQN